MQGHKAELLKWDEINKKGKIKLPNMLERSFKNIVNCFLFQQIYRLVVFRGAQAISNKIRQFYLDPRTSQLLSYLYVIIFKTKVASPKRNPAPFPLGAVYDVVTNHFDIFSPCRSWVGEQNGLKVAMNMTYGKID